MSVGMPPAEARPPRCLSRRAIRLSKIPRSGLRVAPDPPTGRYQSPPRPLSASVDRGTSPGCPGAEFKEEQRKAEAEAVASLAPPADTATTTAAAPSAAPSGSGSAPPAPLWRGPSLSADRAPTTRALIFDDTPVGPNGTAPRPHPNGGGAPGGAMMPLSPRRMQVTHRIPGPFPEELLDQFIFSIRRTIICEAAGVMGAELRSVRPEEIFIETDGSLVFIVTAEFSAAASPRERHEMQDLLLTCTFPATRRYVYELLSRGGGDAAEEAEAKAEVNSYFHSYHPQENRAGEAGTPDPRALPQPHKGEDDAAQGGEAGGEEGGKKSRRSRRSTSKKAGAKKLKKHKEAEEASAGQASAADGQPQRPAGGEHHTPASDISVSSFSTTSTSRSLSVYSPESKLLRQEQGDEEGGNDRGIGKPHHQKKKKKSGSSKRHAVKAAWDEEEDVESVLHQHRTPPRLNPQLEVLAATTPRQRSVTPGNSIMNVSLSTTARKRRSVRRFGQGQRPPWVSPLDDTVEDPSESAGRDSFLYYQELPPADSTPSGPVAPRAPIPMAVGEGSVSPDARPQQPPIPQPRSAPQPQQLQQELPPQQQHLEVEVDLDEEEPVERPAPPQPPVLMIIPAGDSKQPEQQQQRPASPATTSDSGSTRHQQHPMEPPPAEAAWIPGVVSPLSSSSSSARGGGGASSRSPYREHSFAHAVGESFLLIDFYPEEGKSSRAAAAAAESEAAQLELFFEGSPSTLKGRNVRDYVAEYMNVEPQDILLTYKQREITDGVEGAELGWTNGSLVEVTLRRGVQSPTMPFLNGGIPPVSPAPPPPPRTSSAGVKKRTGSKKMKKKGGGAGAGDDDGDDAGKQRKKKKSKASGGRRAGPAAGAGRPRKASTASDSAGSLQTPLPNNSPPAPYAISSGSSSSGSVAVGNYHQMGSGVGRGGDSFASSSTLSSLTPMVNDSRPPPPREKLLTMDTPLSPLTAPTPSSLPSQSRRHLAAPVVYDDPAVTPEGPRRRLPQQHRQRGGGGGGRSDDSATDSREDEDEEPTPYPQPYTVKPHHPQPTATGVVRLNQRHRALPAAMEEEEDPQPSEAPYPFY
eukprot:gene3809-2695_t